MAKVRVGGTMEEAAGSRSLKLTCSKSLASWSNGSNLTKNSKALAKKVEDFTAKLDNELNR